MSRSYEDMGADSKAFEQFQTKRYVHGINGQEYSAGMRLACRLSADVPALLAAVSRVRELHQRAPVDEDSWCSDCGDYWPCRTLRALGGDGD